MKWDQLDIREITEGQFESWYAMADAHRRRKADEYRTRADRLCSIAGDHLAREAVAAHCGVAPEAVAFAVTAEGKPYAVGLDVHFNISHSGDRVVCAVSDRPIGVDVQQIRPVRRNLARKVCTPEELQYLMEAPGWTGEDDLTEEALRRFFRIWTSKEAYFKWAGTGITDLRGFNTMPHIRAGGTTDLEGYVISIYQG